MRLPFFLSVAFAAAGSMPAQPGAEPPFCDAFGVISIEAENATEVHGWEQKNYYTGIALRLSAPPGCAEYQISVSRPGAYRVFLLGARGTESDTPVDIAALALARENEPFGLPCLIRLPLGHAPAWSDLNAQGQPGATLILPAPGRWRLRLSSAQGTSFTVDKIVLTSRDYTPAGTGPAETRSPDVDVTATGFDPLIILPPAWAFGVLYGGYTNQTQTLDAIDQLASADFPIDAYWIDSWFWNFRHEGRGPEGYLSFREDQTAFPDIAAMWGEFQRRHIKAGIWIWDCILREGNEAVFDEFDRKRYFADVFVRRDRWHDAAGISICGNINFDSAEASAFWQQRLAPFFDAGLDFLKIDRSSAINFGKAAFEATQHLGRETKGRGFILAHLHSTHDPRFKLYPTKWSGDAKVAWSQPDYPDFGLSAMGGLRENIQMVADPKQSTYEVPFLAHDAGGYNTFSAGPNQADFDAKLVNDELYTRWLQFAALNTVTTLFSSQPNPTRNHPTGYAAETQTIVRHYLHLRMRLFPYLYTAALETRLTGRKPVQGDRIHDDQYLLGPSLLVAPVYTPGTTRRDVWLPAGLWYEWDSDRAHDGGRSVLLDAPLARIPLLVPAGAIIPLRDYAPSIEAGNNDHLTLEIWPARTPSAYCLREDDGTSNEYLDGGFASTLISVVPSAGSIKLKIAPTEGSFSGMPPDRSWTVHVHHSSTPRHISLNGTSLTFAYEAGPGLLTLSFRAPKAVGQEILIE